MFITEIGIDGMMCGQCESHVCALLRIIDGALVVKASHLKNEAVLYSPKPVGKGEVEKALDGSGYRILSFSQDQSEKEPLSYRIKSRRYDKARR